MTEQERTIHLRVKVKSLADEARSIRAEARKVSGMVKWNLNDHRTTVVRTHARLNLLAYGVLRGVPYCAMERKCETLPKWDKVRNIATRFGGLESDMDEWFTAAVAYTQKPKIRERLSA